MPAALADERTKPSEISPWAPGAYRLRRGIFASAKRDAPKSATRRRMKSSKPNQARFPDVNGCTTNTQGSSGRVVSCATAARYKRS